MNIYKQIFKAIKKYDTIVIARHIGADPDALGAQFALKEIILKLFPNKKVYAVGNPASRFKFFGTSDKIDNIDTTKGLCMVLDTPDIKRIDGANINNFEYVIKIDHHPFIDKYGNIEYIDDNETEEYSIVGSTEADPFENRISNESPMGAALLGAKKNEIVEVNAPAGVMKYKVLSITK